MPGNKCLRLFFLSIFLLVACAPVPAAIPVVDSSDPLPFAILDAKQPVDLASASSQVEGDLDPILPGLRSLIVQRRLALLEQPGWLHVVTRNTKSVSPLSSVWGTVPETWHEEQWLEIDNGGRILRSVKRLLDDNLQPVQTAILVNRTWMNLTISLTLPEDRNEPFDPDYGYYNLVLRLAQQGQPLSKGIIYRECWYQGEQYSISDGDYKYEAVYNPDQISLRWLKTWKVSETPLRLIENTEILIEERVAQPPAEIQSLLDESLLRSSMSTLP